MKRVLTALVLIPLVLGLLFAAPPWLFAAAVGVVAVLAADEFLVLAKGYGLQPFRITTLLFIALYFAGIALRDRPWKVDVLGNSDTLAYSIMVRVFPLLLLVLGMTRKNLRTAFPAAAASYLAIPYIALTLAALVYTRGLHDGTIWLLYFLLLIWSGDIFAYYVGRSFGRHPMAREISPKKTWEGAVASFIGAIGVGFLLFECLDPITNGIAHFLFQMGGSHTTNLFEERVKVQVPSLLHILLFSALINIAAQAGDLVESMIKRGANVKDSGSLLPGHGGVLDRIDALLLAAPVVWYYASIIRLTG